MSPVEWFYAQQNKRFGPVSAAELKALAEAGKLHPDDLVWREGMDNWVAARRVKGLFEADSPTPQPSAVPEAEPAPPTPAPSPAPVEPAAFPVAPTTAFAPAPGVPEGPGRGFENSLAAFYRAREGISVHPFDLILDLFRRSFPAALIEATCQTFSVVGYYTLYGAMALFLMITLAQSIDAKQVSFLGWGAAGVIALVVLQYTAGRFLPALERLNKSSPGRVCSTAFLDCLALLFLALGVAGVLSLVVYAVLQNQYLVLLLALELFIVVELAALVAVAPETVQITVSPEIRVGEEALGVSTFLGKLLLKLAPVLFGLGVLQGIIELLYASILLVSQKPEASGMVWGGFIHLGAAAATPLVVYVLFLSWYLIIDLMRAVLETPRLLRKTLGPSEQQPPEEN